MLKMIFRFLRRLLQLLLVFGALGILLPRIITSFYAIGRTFSVDAAPANRVAIIFGAGLRWDGTPTAVLRDRVETGVHLYFSGKVEKLLMSGDNSVVTHNEPEAMRQYAISLGVPDDAIVLDYAGRRTYDTCFRAQAIFGVENAILVTQKFHLPRALFLCNTLGLRAIGVEANNLTYRRSSLAIWNVREQLATVTAFIDLFVDKPEIILGSPEPIFSE